MSVIDPDNDTGTDYLSLAAFVTGEAGDQAGAAVLAEFRASSGSADTAVVNITGFSNYASFDIKPHADNVAPNGVYTTSGYRLEYTATAGYQNILTLTDDSINLTDVQVKATNSGGYSSLSTVRVAGNTCVLDGLIVVGVLSGASSTAYGVRFLGVSTGTIQNSLIYDFVNSAEACYGIEGSSATDDNVLAYNNTVINCRNGYFTAYQDIRAVNCIAQDCNDGFVNSFSSNSDYNLSDIASDAPGSNSVNSSTLTFVDAANDDYHLAAGDTDAIGAGIGPSSDANVPTTDVDGDARSGTTCDIGFDEYVAVAGGTTLHQTTNYQGMNRMNGAMRS